jgi:DNA-binding HxlR family transcriptional regulator
VLRFSELERAIPTISVRRIVHHQVPPKVEYCLTNWGQALCPALDTLLKSSSSGRCSDVSRRQAARASA